MSVGRAALLIAALTAASRALGFVREAVYAAVFGAGAELDAFLAAQGLPNIVITLIASAVVTSAVPVLAGQLGRGDREQSDRTFNTIFTVVLSALVVLALVVAAAARPLLEATAPGFDSEQLDRAVELARILLLGSAFVGAMNLIAGLLQAHREFFWPALVGIPFNLVMIVAAAVFGGEFGVIALAVGFVIGSGLRVAFEVPGLRKIRFRPRLSLDLRDPGLRLVLAMAPLILIGNSVGNVNTIVDRLVGSLEGEGVISALNYGFRLIALPHALLALALLQAIYPSLGEAAERGDAPRMRGLVERGLSSLAVALLPLAAACVALSEPIVELVYGRGEFDAADVELTAKAVAFYAPAILLLGWRDLLARSFYALGDARTPVLTAVLAMIVNVAGDLTLGRSFGIAGIAGSTTLALIVAFGGLALALRRRGETIDLVALGLGTLRVLVAAALAGALMAALSAAIDGSALLRLALAGGAGLGVYVLLLRLLAAEQASALAADLGDAVRALRSRGR